MELTLALLADYANVTREGKLNVMGIFELIFAQSFPCNHVQMALVMQFALEPFEAAGSHEIKVQLVDPDGKNLVQIKSTLTLPEKGPGIPARIAHIQPLTNVAFPGPGDHELRITVDEKLGRVVPLKVMLHPSRPPSKTP
mgnify:CR=1 FL=1